MHNLSVSWYKSFVYEEVTIERDGKWSILSDSQSKNLISQKPNKINFAKREKNKLREQDFILFLSKY